MELTVAGKRGDKILSKHMHPQIHTEPGSHRPAPCDPVDVGVGMRGE